MKKHISLTIKLVGLLLIFFTFSGVSELLGAEPEDKYIFNKSKIRIEGSLSPFEATIEINELGLNKYIVHIYLHSTYAAAPPSFSVSVKFPKDKINQIWNSKTWSNKSFGIGV